MIRGVNGLWANAVSCRLCDHPVTILAPTSDKNKTNLLVGCSRPPQAVPDRPFHLQIGGLPSFTASSHALGIATVISALSDGGRRTQSRRRHRGRWVLDFGYPSISLIRAFANSIQRENLGAMDGKKSERWEASGDSTAGRPSYRLNASPGSLRGLCIRS